MYPKSLPYAICLQVACGAALAQSIPDAGSLLRESERQQQRTVPAPQAVPTAPAEQKKGDKQVTVTVKAFRFVGNQLVADVELQDALSTWIGKTVGYEELQQAVNALAEVYRRRGWFARPMLPEQDITEGVITIRIIEGRLGAVRIDDQGKPLRMDKDFVLASMTARQKPGGSLNLDDLDRSTNILNDTPGILVSTVLSAGANDGESDAIVRVRDKPLMTAYVQGDNQGARSTGENKVTANGTLDNPSGTGDQVQFNSNASRGSEYARLGYSLPLGRDGLRLGISTSCMQYRLVGDLASLKGKGDAQTYGINGAYPLQRSNTRNINVALSYDRKSYYNEANATATSEKKVDAIAVILSGDQLDAAGGGGLNQWNLGLGTGHLDLSANPTNAQSDRNGPRTSGQYSRLSYGLSRLQRLADKATLWATLSGQHAFKNLDSSEKMSLGGPSGVRAYPVIEGTGDEGWQTTLEARYAIRPDLQVSVFYDHGWIRQSHDPNYIGSPQINSGTLKGAGIGLSWSQSGDFTLRATWAGRIGNNPFANPLNGKDQDGSLDRDRLWLSGVMFF